MIKKLVLITVLPLFFAGTGFGQLCQGPAQGSVSSGVIVSTGTFAKTITLTEPQKPIVHNKETYTETPVQMDFSLVPSVKQVYTEDASCKEMAKRDSASLLIKSFDGIPQQNGIPPDPYIAVGPNHIISIVNSVFCIWDKNGGLLKTISGDQFFTPVVPGVSTFDPKILYDHFSKRWVMVWLHADQTNKKAYFLLAVSASDNPLGNWCTWALPSSLNGATTVDQWGDYQGVGYDDSCIYITSNQFSNAGTFQYAKIRIVPKAQLYNNTAGAVVWNDLWNIQLPSYGGSIFCVRPSIARDHESGYYLTFIPNYSANFIAVYKISNPATSPSLSGNILTVNNFYPASNAGQLGGGSMLLEGGGGQLRNEPKVMDNKMWLTHTVRNPYATSNSAVRYLQVDLTGAVPVLLKDQLLGASGFWHFYSALDVDKDQNVAITYSRSGNTEYAGAYYTYGYRNDAALRNSNVLQAGRANYVKDYGSGRNRWGDYNGIIIDPSDSSSFWLFGEYVSAKDTWGTWTGEMRLSAFPGTNLAASSLNFSNVEINNISDTLTSYIRNWGSTDLTINSIPDSVGPFKFVNNLTLPYTVSPYDTLAVKIVFKPTTARMYDTVYTFNSSIPSFAGVPVKGKGFIIKPVNQDIVYASTGSGSQGAMFTVNTTTGNGTLLGSSLQNEIKSIAINPKTKIMYGIVAGLSNTGVYRVNAELGDSYLLKNVPLTNTVAIAFDTNGVCIMALKTGEFYQVNLETGDTIKLSSSHISINNVTVNLLKNEFWASFYAAVGTNRDKLYKVNPYTGDTVFVGKTGFGVVTNALAFDKLGNLYGITGTATAINNLVKIDTLTGTGTIIGATSFKNVTGLSVLYSKPSAVEDDRLSEIPSDFVLRQNYPNPFNPSTTIEYSLPANANVKIMVYNLLGELVSTLVNNNVSAGTHRVVWDASRFTSGTYFYEINVNCSNGKNYTQIKKMIFMK